VFVVIRYSLTWDSVAFVAPRQPFEHVRRLTWCYFWGDQVMRSLVSSSDVDELIARLDRLSPDTPRRWGTMTPHEMLCHLADSFRAMTGEREISRVPASGFRRRVMRFVALQLPLPWPKGIPTMPEVDPKRKGTPPAVFETDRQALLALLRRFLSEEARYTEHPTFGPMPRREWLIWGYRHMDHHLRQFGL
jgi:hypothetical protein